MKLPEHPRIVPLTVKAVLAGRPARAVALSLAATVGEALPAMAADAAGGVAVVDGERVAGVFCARDYVRLQAAAAAGRMPLREVIAATAVSANADQPVRTCLALMDANGLDCIAVADAGKLLGLLGRAELQKALIAHYESIFAAMALDRKILFLQGTYSC